MKLHLGCGQVHLDGYLNIDFPPANHTVQTISGADEFHNILELSYPSDSIDEVRLHHVFEHFSRPVACALTASWWSWLKPNGVLHVEVPDFDRSAWAVISPCSSEKARYVALRHIFGSQEAAWALHQEGWSPKRLQRFLTLMGFTISSVSKNSYQGTYNFEITAVKNDAKFTENIFEEKAQNYLEEYCVNNSSTEQKMLQIWMELYRNQIEKTWAIQ
jgi:predicted SAM-dependent methyltransferase